MRRVVGPIGWMGVLGLVLALGSTGRGVDTVPGKPPTGPLPAREERATFQVPRGIRVELAACEPVYESMPGWSQPTKGVRRYGDLPEKARHYIARLEEVTGVPAAVISTGSERDETILREDVLKDRISDLRLAI